MGKALPSTRVPRRYAPKAAIDRALEAVRANGIRVASVTINPDGSIRLSSIDDASARSETVFDTLDRAGRL